jgi:phosphinothricin acetyltransferase
MKFSHRDAELNDLPQIVDIYNTSIPSRESTCDMTPVTVESRLAWFNGHSKNRRPIWVAVDEDTPDKKVIGYLSFSYFMNERPGYYITSDMAVYLHPDYRGKGLGTYLLQSAVEAAPELGIETLVTTIFSSNTASIRLFEAAGFERWGYMPRVARLGTIERDLVMVGRRLS